MRNALLVAALLTWISVPTVAFAFETDAAGNTNPDGSQRYTDPDESPQFGSAEQGNASSSRNTMRFGNGVVSGYTGSSDSAGPGDQPWLTPRARTGH
jgi:hypothetical protein